MKIKAEDMVNVNSEKLKEATQEINLSALSLVVGRSAQYYRSTIREGRMGRVELEKLCVYMGRTTDEFVVKSAPAGYPREDRTEELLSLIAELDARVRRLEEAQK